MSVGTIVEIEDHAQGYLGAVLLSESLLIEAVSDGVVEIGGHSRDSLIGLPAWDVLHPDDLERAAEALGELIRTQVPTVDGVYRMRYADGSYHDYAISALTVRDGDRVKSILKFSPVSPLLRAEEFTRDAVDTLRMLAESRPLEDCLERVHRLIHRHLPDTRVAISTLHDGRFHRHDRDADGTFRPVELPRELAPNVERALDHHRDGPWRAFNRMAEFEATAGGGRVTSVLTDESDVLIGWFEVSRDSTAEPDDREWMVHGLVRQVLTALLRRLKLDQQLLEAAEQDPLTGLANRRRLFGDMAGHGDLSGTQLLLVDLDNFSWINNNLGHHVGDKALVALGDRLRELSPADATVARFGGDEFVVWSPNPLPDVAAFAEALRSSNLTPPDSGDRRASVRCSIGAITIADDESTADALTRADAAMYVAKRAGGDRAHQG